MQQDRAMQQRAFAQASKLQQDQQAFAERMYELEQQISAQDVFGGILGIAGSVGGGMAGSLLGQYIGRK